MSLWDIKKIKFPIILITLSVLAFGFVCSGMASHASMYGGMNSIAIMQIGSQQTCCNTSISKNIESWKNTLLVVPREMHNGLLILILGLIATLTLGLSRLRPPFSDYHLQFYRQYERDNSDLALFNHLKLAFARGILNPKIY